MSLKGKVAIVTGSSRGIGRASAVALAREQVNVVINYLEHEKEADETVDIIQKMGSKALKVQADVRKFQNILEMVDITMKTFGRIDILVNNAGIVRDKYQLTIYFRKRLKSQRNLEEKHTAPHS